MFGRFVLCQFNFGCHTRRHRIYRDWCKLGNVSRSFAWLWIHQNFWRISTLELTLSAQVHRKRAKKPSRNEVTMKNSCGDYPRCEDNEEYWTRNYQCYLQAWPLTFVTTHQIRAAFIPWAYRAAGFTFVDIYYSSQVILWSMRSRWSQWARFENLRNLFLGLFPALLIFQDLPTFSEYLRWCARHDL